MEDITCAHKRIVRTDNLPEEERVMGETWVCLDCGLVNRRSGGWSGWEKPEKDSDE